MASKIKRDELKSKFDVPPLYSTDNGLMYNGDSKVLLNYLDDASIDLIITSPPYALLKKKAYGNVKSQEYIEWFRPFATQFHRILKPHGSFVLNIGGAWNRGTPTRSLYPYEMVLMLVKELKFYLAQEFFWYNPSKLPAPIQWVNIDRVRVKDSVEYIWWLSKTPRPRADNRKILSDYSSAMLKLLKDQKYNHGKRPSGHNISKTSWLQDKGGSIPPNVIATLDTEERNGNIINVANTPSHDYFSERCRQNDRKLHPARFPTKIPQLFIEFLTTKRSIVLDPFAGSNTTGHIAEEKGRNWLSFEMDEEYAKTSYLRFVDKLPTRFYRTQNRVA